jgi:hypothetical protein
MIVLSQPIRTITLPFMLNTAREETQLSEPRIKLTHMGARVTLTIKPHQKFPAL